MGHEAERVRMDDGFKPIKDFNYGGRFLNAIEVNEEAIKKVFGLAGLVYSGITIEPMPQSDIDVSKGLRKKPLFMTGKINDGWKIQINDGEIMARLDKKYSRDGHRKEFIQELNGLIKSAVLECIIKEKFSNRQDSDLPLPGLSPEAFDIVRCWFFLHPASGITLARESK